MGELCSGGATTTATIGGVDAAPPAIVEVVKLEEVAVQLVADVEKSSKNIQKMIEGVDFDRSDDFDEFDESSLYPTNGFPLI